MKHPLTREEILFSEWLESMCKDIECTFALMKQRFYILKYGICLQKKSNIDKMWSNCCALHNVLMCIDGLDKGRDEFFQDESKLAFDIPFSMQLLSRHEENM